MKRLTLGLCIVVTLVYSQTGETQPTFEVASIKPSEPITPGTRTRIGCTGGPGTTSPGIWTCQNLPIGALITMAYDLRRYQFSPPDWMRLGRFEISAKIPLGTTKEQFRLMQQNLLAERFKLVLHRESKEMPIYDLTVGKNGIKMKEAGPPTEEGPTPDSVEQMPKFKMGKDGTAELIGPGLIGLNGHFTWNAPNISMDEFVVKLSDQVDRPVVNSTGLKGRYEFSAHWVTESMPIPPGALPPGAPTPVLADDSSGPSLERAVQDQLGLKLESKKGTGDIIVIDHMEKTPIEN